MHAKFTSISFEIFVIAVVAGFLVYNLAVLFTSGTWIALLPISVQTTLILLFITKHKYLALGLKIWSVFFIVAGGLRLFGIALEGITGSPDSNKIVWGSINLVLGIILYLIASQEIEMIAEPTETKE